MSFDWLPRPQNDNGIGLHDDGMSGADTIPRMYSLIDEMRDKRFHWLTLVMNVNTEKLDLIRYARDRDIMPIMRPFEQPCHPTSRIPEWFVKACMDHGAVYFIDWNEPNLGGVECTRPYNEYKYNGSTGHQAFVNLLLDQWLQDADTVRRCGGIPLLFPMSPTEYTSNSVYYHHRLYEELVGLAKLRGSLHWAFEKTGIAIHNRPGDGQPLDEPDRCAFRDYEWIEGLFKDALGYEIPLFGTESGYESGMITKHLETYHGIPNPDQMLCLEYHKRLNHAIFERFNPEHPKRWADYLICQNMWLSHDAAASWPGSGWKLNQWALGEAPAWRDMHEIPYFVRAEGGEPPPPPPPPPPPLPPPSPDGIEGGELLEKYNLTLESCQLPGYRLIALRERCEAANCDVTVLDSNGNPIPGFLVRWGWPGTEVTQLTDPHGRAGFAMASSAYYSPEEGQSGPHWTAASVGLESDVLRGIGMIAGTVHCTVNPTFRYFAEEAPPPPPPPDEYTIFDACAKLGIELQDDRAKCGEFANPTAIPKRKPREWNGIIIHHTGSTNRNQTVEGIAKYHTDPEPDGRGFDSIAYHITVDFEGVAHFTAPVRWETTHTGTNLVNTDCIGIAVMGDFTSEEPTAAQLETLRRLILALWDWRGRGEAMMSFVAPHNYVNDTACPGVLKERLWQGEWPTLP